MQVKIKRLSELAKIPKYATAGSAGMDIYCTSVKYTDNYVEYGTSLSFEIPEGFCALLLPRSSISNYGLTLANSCGLLDADFRGEVTFRFRTTSPTSKVYMLGERVGQILIMQYPKIEFLEVHDLSETERNTGGYGHSGT